MSSLLLSSLYYVVGVDQTSEADVIIDIDDYKDVIVYNLCTENSENITMLF